MTFLQRLLLNQKSNPASINDHEIMMHAMGNISAGSDTTAIALRAVIYYVLKNPEAYRTLCQEVRENLSLPVNFAKANSLPYLTSCLREAMRLHPSVGLILGRSVPEEGAEICGFDIAGGVEVGINPWVLHRNPEVFPRPDEFVPERWLASESGEDQLKLMNRSFFTFGHGAHTCSGRHISILEMTKVIPSLILRYDMELVDHGVAYRFKNRWFTPQEGLFVRLKRHVPKYSS